MKLTITDQNDKPIINDPSTRPPVDIATGEEDVTATHGKNGVPELRAVDGGTWAESLPGVVVHAALLLGACAAIGMVLP